MISESSPRSLDSVPLGRTSWQQEHVAEAGLDLRVDRKQREGERCCLSGFQTMRWCWQRFVSSVSPPRECPYRHSRRCASPGSYIRTPLLLFGDRVCLCSIGYPGACHLYQAGLGLTEIFWPLPPEFWMCYHTQDFLNHFCLTSSSVSFYTTLGVQAYEIGMQMKH